MTYDEAMKQLELGKRVFRSTWVTRLERTADGGVCVTHQGSFGRMYEPRGDDKSATDWMVEEPAPPPATIVRRYTPAQNVERHRLIDLIKGEQRAYLERVEPYVKALADIEATSTPTILVSAHLKKAEADINFRDRALQIPVQDALPNPFDAAEKPADVS